MIPSHLRRGLPSLAGGVLLAGCGSNCAPAPAPTAAPAPAARPDVVLVTLDTTRADRLGAYGHAQADTSWLDGKAAAGMRFQRAYAVQPLTIPAHSSIMTGLWPWRHGVRSNGDAVLDDSMTTLAERFQAGGWQTGASVAAFVTSRDWGFHQGFDTFLDQIEQPGKDTWHAHRTADKVVDDAITIVDGAQEGQPLFLWVHVYDAHFPYTPPEPYAERFAGRPYDGELAFVDDQLERLDAALSAKGRQPLWVLVGDHGESLGEHRELTHGLFVYDATQHIPLIIAGPGVAPAVVEQPVSQVDLVPTILSLTGRPVPEDVDGKVQPGNPHPAWMESFQLTEQFGYAPHTAVVDGSHKLIHKPQPELYDLAGDPGEREDLAAAQPEQVQRLKGVMDVLGPVMPTGRTQALDPVALARLQALGYITTSSFDVDFASLPDPALHKEVVGKVLRAEMMAMQGQHEDGLVLMKEALDEQPDVAGLYTRYGRMLFSAGKKDEGVALLNRAADRFPKDVNLLLRAASTIGRAGGDNRSLELARRALQADPASDQAAEFVTGALINLGKRDEALAFTATWLTEHPAASNIAALRGILLFDGGNVKDAEPLLRQAAKESRPREGVCQRLGAMALGAGVLKDAVRWLEREQELHGVSPRTDRLLLVVLNRMGEKERALALADRLLKDQPADPELLHARGVALFDLGRVDEARTEVEAALVKVPEQPDLLMLLANILRKQGLQAEAEAMRVRADAAHTKRLEQLRKMPPPPPQSGG